MMRGFPGPFRQFMPTTHEGFLGALIVALTLLSIVGGLYYEFDLNRRSLVSFDMQPDSFFHGRHRY